MKHNYAWHFINGDKLRDGSQAAQAGGVEKYSGKLELCKSGLHFSRNPYDALKYANGATLRLVDVRGEAIEPSGEDKGCCSERAVVGVMDASELLRYFARMQAISCLDNWESDPRDIVMEWLFTGDESIRNAARKAAYSAADSAGYSAARSAADSAGYSATYSAAYSAARSAEYSADSAAYSAAYNARRAAYSAARNEFTQLVYECFEEFL